MSFDQVKLKIFIYGVDKDKIDNISRSVKQYSVQKILLSSDNKNLLTEDKIILQYLHEASQLMFINADSMKKNNILGLDNISKTILKAEDKSKKSPYVVLFNRYLDSNLQTHYIGELDYDSGVSMFQSFNPGNSDAFYLSEKAVTLLRNLTSPNSKHNSKKILFSLIREGRINAYSFNPNLYVFRLEDSSANNNDQVFKSSIIKHDQIMENRCLDRNISLFFSDHIILFWIFIVFFICTVLLLILRAFKIGSYFL